MYFTTNFILVFCYILITRWRHGSTFDKDVMWEHCESKQSVEKLRNIKSEPENYNL